MPSTDSTLPERRRRRRTIDSTSAHDTPFLVRRNPPGQLDQPIIPENNTCVSDSISPLKYASFDLKKGKTYRFRLINHCQSPTFNLPCFMRILKYCVRRPYRQLLRYAILD